MSVIVSHLFVAMGRRRTSSDMTKVVERKWVVGVSKHIEVHAPLKEMLLVVVCLSRFGIFLPPSNTFADSNGLFYGHIVVRHKVCNNINVTSCSCSR